MEKMNVSGSVRNQKATTSSKVRSDEHGPSLERIRTGYFGHRDRRAPKRPSSRQAAVSASDTPNSNAQTLQNRANFSFDARTFSRSLCARRLRGGEGESRGGTRLWTRFPDSRGTYWEFPRTQAPLSESGPRILSVSETVPTDFLWLRTGNLFRRRWSSWDFD